MIETDRKQSHHCSDPGQRPTAQEVLDHFFFAKTNVQTTASEKKKNSH